MVRVKKFLDLQRPSSSCRTVRASEAHGGRRPEGVLGQGVNLYVQCEDAVALHREFRSASLKQESRLSGIACGLQLSVIQTAKLDFECATDVQEDAALSEFEASKKN